MAAADYYTQVYTMFVGYFGRPPAQSGLDYYANLVNAAGGKLDAVLDDFHKAAESQALFAGKSIEQQVNIIFQNLFGRDAAPTGLNYWAGEIAAGRLALSQAAYAISQGAQTADKGVLTAKIDSAKLWVAGLDTTTEILSFSTEAGRTAGRDFLKTITTSTPAAQTAVDAALTSMVNGGNTNPGQTFTLTNSTDNVVGTAGNDTIVGDDVSASAGDQINGGDGIDTLKLYGNATKPAITNVEKVYLNGNTAGFDVSTNTAVTNLDLDDAATGKTYTIANGQAVSVANMAAGEAIDFAGNTVTSLKMGLNAVSASGNDVTVNLNSVAQTSLDITTSGTKSQITLTNTGAKLETINIAASVALELGHALTTVKTINASTSTAGVDIDAVGASSLTFTGGSGNDRIALAATLTSADTIKGGTGADTLSISDADTMDSAAEVANVTEFEIFEAAGADATTYDLSFLNAKNSLQGLIVAAGATVTVSNINAATTGNINIVTDTTTVLTASDFVSGGTSDTATINLGTGTSGVNNVDANVTFAYLDVLNLVSKSDGTPTKTVGGGEQNSISLTATDLEKIVITGQEAVVVTTAAATLPTEIDASGMTDAAVSVDTDASAIVSLLVKGTAKDDTIDIDNVATITSTLYLGGGSDTVVVDGGGTSAHALKFTATALNAGDIKAGNASTVTLSTAGAGDTITLDFTAALEGLLKSGGTLLSATSANVNVHGTTLSSTTNIAAAQAAGNMVVQIDLNGDGAYNATDDYQITLVGTGTNDTLVYNAATDVLTFTVVA